jgi:hypothetical protein
VAIALKCLDLIVLIDSLKILAISLKVKPDNNISLKLLLSFQVIF